MFYGEVKMGPRGEVWRDPFLLRIVTENRCGCRRGVVAIVVGVLCRGCCGRFPRPLMYVVLCVLCSVFYVRVCPLVCACGCDVSGGKPCRAKLDGRFEEVVLERA